METKNISLSSLIPHEDIVEDRVCEIMRLFGSGWFEPIIVESSHNIVLDGHHRIEAARRLGWDAILCNVVDYDSEVNLKFWNDNISCAKCDIIRRALRGTKFPPKTTRHILCEDCTNRQLV